jgi:hypothetical protein
MVTKTKERQLRGELKFYIFVTIELVLLPLLMQGLSLTYPALNTT